MKLLLVISLLLPTLCSAQEEHLPERITPPEGAKKCIVTSEIRANEPPYNKPDTFAIHCFDGAGNDTFIRYMFHGKVNKRLELHYNNSYLSSYSEHNLISDLDNDATKSVLAPTNYVTVAYDRQGRLTTKTDASFPYGDTMTSINIFTYDEQDRLKTHTYIALASKNTVYTRTGSDGITRTSTSDTIQSLLVYTDTGKLEYSFGKLVSVTKSKYNSRGQLLEAVSVSTNGVTLKSESYQYDSAGRVIESQHFTNLQPSLPHPNTRTTYSYDDQGFLKEERTYSEDMLISIMTYEFTY